MKTTLLFITFAGCISLWGCSKASPPVFIGRTLVHTIDAETQQSIPVRVEVPGLTPKQEYPIVTIETTGDDSKLSLQWKATYPFDMELSSEGRRSKTITIDQNTQTNMVIRLERLR